MEVLFVLLPVALLFAAVAVGVFIWAARSGQFDDLDTPAMRILHDEPQRLPSDARSPMDVARLPRRVDDD